MSTKVTPKGIVKFSTLKEPQGFKGSDKNKKYSIAVEFSGADAKELKEKVFTRAKMVDDKLTVYFNRKDTAGKPAVKMEDGSTIDMQILPKGSTVAVAYTLKDFEFLGTVGQSYVLEAVKIYSMATEGSNGATLDFDSNDAPF